MAATDWNGYAPRLYDPRPGDRPLARGRPRPQTLSRPSASALRFTRHSLFLEKDSREKMPELHVKRGGPFGNRPSRSPGPRGISDASVAPLRSLEPLGREDDSPATVLMSPSLATKPGERSKRVVRSVEKAIDVGEKLRPLAAVPLCPEREDDPSEQPRPRVAGDFAPIYPNWAGPLVSGFKRSGDPPRTRSKNSPSVRRGPGRRFNGHADQRRAFTLAKRYCRYDSLESFEVRPATSTIGPGSARRVANDALEEVEVCESRADGTSSSARPDRQSSEYR